MARVNLTDIQPGDSMDRVVTNTMLTAIVTATGDIDEENIRDGGLDERNFADDAVTLQPQLSGDRQRYSTPLATSSINDTSAPANPISTSAGSVVTGPFAYNSANLTRLLVKYSAHYASSKPLNPAEEEWTFQLGYSTDWNGSSGTWALIDATKRRASTRIGTDGLISDNSITIAHRFAETGMNTTTLYFGVFVWDADNTASDTIVVDGHNLYGIVLET